MPRPWIVRHQPQPDAKVRLYCFPYAGSGAAIYRTWPNALPPTVEVCAVQPPGRESRFGEVPFADLRQFIGALAETLAPRLEPPFALFGHSYGAWAAFEFARQLHDRGGPQPAHLFVSGHRAPRLPDRFPPLHRLPDRELPAELERRYGGIPPEIAGDPVLMRRFIPAIRADLTAAETYAYTPGPQLDCAVSVFGGTVDESTTRSELEGWRQETTGPFHLDLLPGGHLFLGPAQDRLLALVASRL